MVSVRSTLLILAAMLWLPATTQAAPQVISSGVAQVNLLEP